ncbi:MAG: hypothetical protein G01um101420_95 [Parcubacteria group bacterium Gr01-1014_20]|nr:MAG: hypothetical protein G01um101420_95 [Parcubacteria group bacterium Gr01-1014_20]
MSDWVKRGLGIETSNEIATAVIVTAREATKITKETHEAVNLTIPDPLMMGDDILDAFAIICSKNGRSLPRKTVALIVDDAIYENLADDSKEIRIKLFDPQIMSITEIEFGKIATKLGVDVSIEMPEETSETSDEASPTG